MPTWRAPVIAIIAGGLLHGSAATAPAATCGTAPKGEKRPATGALVLKKDVSTVSLDFGRGDDPQTASLVFRVDGCRLGDRAVRRLEISVGPAPDLDQLPDDAVTAPGEGADDDDADLTAVRRGRQVDVDLVVDPSRFDPGAYGALVTVSGRGVATSRTPLAIQRSEGNLAVPALLGALGGLAGIVWFLVLKFATAGNRIHISWWWIPLVIGFAIVAGAVGGFFAWQAQQVWTFDENVDDTLLAGFGGATTGAMAALLAALGFSSDAEDDDDEEHQAPQQAQQQQQ